MATAAGRATAGETGEEAGRRGATAEVGKRTRLGAFSLEGVPAWGLIEVHHTGLTLELDQEVACGLTAYEADLTS